MKTITKLLCLLAFIAITTKSYAQKETTIYGFGYAYTHGTKTLYVTNIVSGVIYSTQYYDASTTDLKLQWTEKFKNRSMQLLRLYPCNSRFLWNCRSGL